MSNFDLNRIISRSLTQVKNFIQPDPPNTVPYSTQLAAHNLNDPIPLLQHRFYDERTKLYYLDDGQCPHIAFAISCQLSTHHLHTFKNFLQTLLPTLPPLTTLTWGWLSYPTTQEPIQSIQPKHHQQLLFLRTPLTIDPTNTSAVSSFLSTLQNWQHQILSTLQSFPSQTPPELITPPTLRHLIHLICRPSPILAQQTPTPCPPDQILDFDPSTTPIEIDTDGAVLLPKINHSVYHYSIDAFPPPYFNSADPHAHPAFTDEYHLSTFLTPNVPHFQLIPHFFYHYTHISIPEKDSQLLHATHQMQSTINSAAHTQKPWFQSLIHQEKTYIQAPQFLVLSGLIISAPTPKIPELHDQLTTSATASHWRISKEPFLNAALLFNAIPLQFSPQSDHSRRSSFAYFSHLFHTIGAPHPSLPPSPLPNTSPTPAHPTLPPLPLSTIDNTGRQPPLHIHHLSNTILIGGLRSGKTALTTALTHHLTDLNIPTLLISSSPLTTPNALSPVNAITTTQPASHSHHPLHAFPAPTSLNVYATQLLLEVLGAIYTSNAPTLSPTDLLNALWEHIDPLIANPPPSNTPTSFSWPRLLSQTPLAQNSAITHLLSRNHQLLTPPKPVPDASTTIHLQLPALWTELPEPQSAFSAMLSTVQLLSNNPQIKHLIINDIRCYSHPQMHLFFDALFYYCSKMNIAWTLASRTPFNIPPAHIPSWNTLLTPLHKSFLSLPEHSVQYLIDIGTLHSTQFIDTARQLAMSDNSFDLLIPPPLNATNASNDIGTPADTAPIPLPITIHIPPHRP